MKQVLIFFITLILLTPNVKAWGPRGHLTVAELAFNDLTEESKAKIENLFGDDARDALADASLWADQMRDSGKLKHASKFHYINFPKNQCHYVATRDCEKGDCIVSALEQFTSALRDQKRDKQSKIESLRWIAHLVGDIHQPFHAGLKEDLGGNLYQVRFGKEGTNLHTLWDYHLIAKRGLRSRKLAASIYQANFLPPSERSSFTANPLGVIASWAEASCQIAQTKAYPKSRVIDSAYIKQSDVIIDQQLRLAGARLAMVLNQTLQ